MNIERDGIIDEIYYLLWKKQDWIKDSEAFFKLNIPDTLIIKRNTPFSWYFTNKEGFLMRKKVKSMGLDNVYKIFSSGNSNTGIAAFFVQLNQRKVADERFRKFFKLNDDKDIKDDKLVVEYFTPEMLHKFLFEDQREKSGILQKFIEPKGLNNNMIEIIWSPSICLMSKKYNTRSIYEKKYDVYERCVTYEGPEFYSRYITLKSPVASQELRQIVHKIVKRIALVSLERMVINRFVLYFKQHDNGEYYFMYSSSLRVDQGKLSMEGKSKHNHAPMQFEHIFEMPGYVKKLYTIDTKKPRQLICDVQCNLCKKFYQKGDMVPVALKYIIKEEYFKRNYMKIDKKPPSKPEIVPLIIDQEKEEKKLGEDNLMEDRYGIPIILQKLFPQLTSDDYISLMKDERFRMKTIPFCYPCFIELTKNEKLSGINIIQGRTNDDLIKNYISADKNLKEIHDKFLKETKAKAIEQKSFKEQIGLKYSSPKIDAKLLPEHFTKEPTFKSLLVLNTSQHKSKVEGKKALSVASLSTKAPTGSLGSRPHTASKKFDPVRASLDRPKTAVPESVRSGTPSNGLKQLAKENMKRNLSSTGRIRSAYVVKDEYDIFFNNQYKTMSQQLEQRLIENEKKPRYAPNSIKNQSQEEGLFQERLPGESDDDDLFQAKEKFFRELDEKEDFSLDKEVLMEPQALSSPDESSLFDEMHKKMLKDVLRKDEKYLDSDEFISDF